MEKGVSEEPLSKATFSQIFNSVQVLAGFLERATVHAIRHYIGKQIDGRSLRTSKVQKHCDI